MRRATTPGLIAPGLDVTQQATLTAGDDLFMRPRRLMLRGLVMQIRKFWQIVWE
jgi:hypothetical protein